MRVTLWHSLQAARTMWTRPPVLPLWMALPVHRVAEEVVMPGKMFYVESCLRCGLGDAVVEYGPAVGLERAHGNASSSVVVPAMPALLARLLSTDLHTR